MKNDTKPLLLIGNGRLAKHLDHYLTLKSLHLIRWHRDTCSYSDLQRNLSEASGILLAISDRSLESFYNEYLKSSQLPVMHFSGSYSHPTALGAHPLCTFGDLFYELDFYLKIPFVLDQYQTDIQPIWRELLSSLGNPQFFIKSEDKPYYHALCSLSGNFSQYLWLTFFKELERLGIPRRHTYPYVEKVFNNLIQPNFEKPTGPLSRNDVSTIETHIQSLEHSPYQNLYLSFVETYKKGAL